jgi:hypothetical protein
MVAVAACHNLHAMNGIISTQHAVEDRSLLPPLLNSWLSSPCMLRVRTLLPGFLKHVRALFSRHLPH